MRYLQSVIPGSLQHPDPNDFCPYCRKAKPTVELVDSTDDTVIDRGCEDCVRERNDW